jgi:sec-independent protein translocase protein TatA
MPNIGPLEVVVILVLVALIFGAKRIPELGRSAGKGIREFRSSVRLHDEASEEPQAPELTASSEGPSASERPSK